MDSKFNNTKSLSRCLAITAIVMAVIILSIFCERAAAADNSAPVWKPGAIRQDSKTVTMGNPYTPAEFITMKWTDPDGDALKYYYSVNDSEPELCADYMGTESQVQWFAYTFRNTGSYTLKVWASDGKAESEAYVAEIIVVDPEEYEYTMTIMAAPKNADLKFYTCEGFDENGHDIPGEEIKYQSHTRGTDYHQYTIKLKGGRYSFRAEDTAGNDIGGSTFQVPAEAKTAGSSETFICLRELDMGCSTRYDGSDYCGQNFFTPHISNNGHEAVFGDVFQTAGMSYYRTMIVVSGNDMVYQHYLEATDKAEENGYTDGGANSSYTPTAASTAARLQLDLSTVKTATIRAITGSDVRIFFQSNYYAYRDRTEKWLKSKDDNNDGTETWTFNIPSQTTGYTWRVNKAGRLTRAGYFISGSYDIDATGTDGSSPESTDNINVDEYVDNNIMLNVNSRNFLEMQAGDTFDLKSYRAYEISDSSNYIIGPDFHTEVISGKDVVGIRETSTGNVRNDKIRVTARNNGIAVLKVTYDAIDIYRGAEHGIYGAADKVREGIVVVRVGDKNEQNIDLNISGAASRKTEWDTEFDTCYFTAETGSLVMRPVSNDGIMEVSVSSPHDLDWNKVTKTQGEYTIPIAPGNNIVRVTTSSNEEHYQVIRGARYSYVITNLTRAGEAPAAGDTVKLHLDGLYMPVPRMSGVYNPGYGGTGRVIYEGESGETIEPAGVQYNFITAQDLTITIPGYGDGKYTLGNGYMFINIMGAPDPLGKHRSIPDAGLSRMFNAVSSAWSGSSMGDIDIDFSETGKSVQFTGIVEGSEIILTNSYGNDLIPDVSDEEAVTFNELPDGKYEYVISNDDYASVSGEITLKASDTGIKTVEIIQNANDEDVQEVIELIKALPEVDELSENDISAVEAAYEKYEALTDEKKEIVPSRFRDKLEQEVTEVKIMKDPDVQNVISMIRELPDAGALKFADRSDVDAAENAYKALDADQESLISESLRNRLDSIVRRMKELVTEKENQDAAASVIEMLQNLPELSELSLSDKDAVLKVKAEYDTLTKAQKSLIPDSLKLSLQDALDRIKDLEDEEEQKAKEREAAKKKQEKINAAKAVKTKIKAKALKKRKAKITWKKLAGVSGYKVYRATKKKGKYKLVKTIKNSKTVRFNNKKLRKGKKYFYKVIPFTRIDGKVYRGKWSNTVKIKAR